MTDRILTRHVGSGDVYTSKKRDPFTERVAWALCWDFSVGKAGTPRQLFMAQTQGCRERFREHADELARCLKRAGLTVRTR